MMTIESTALNFDAWLDFLREKLPSFDLSYNLAFAASCCERSLPNYKAFAKEERWGDPKVLTEGLELVWRLVTTKNLADLHSYVRSLIKALDAVTPDTEGNFKSILTSAALDAASSVGETLDYALDGNIDHIIWVSSLARDTIDLFVHRRDNPDYSDQNFEEKIANHPLMIAELQKQQMDIKTLESIQDLTPDFVAFFRQNAMIAGKSNLGISA